MQIRSGIILPTETVSDITKQLFVVFHPLFGQPERQLLVAVWSNIGQTHFPQPHYMCHWFGGIPCWIGTSNP